jgi:TPR repeat protein
MSIEDKNLKERAHAGDPEAQLTYGLSLRWERGYYARAGVIGLDPPCEAETWIQKSADQGHAPAQFIMGKIYDALGIGGSAIAYYRQAADQGHVQAKAVLEQKMKIIRPWMSDADTPKAEEGRKAIPHITPPVRRSR